jgi:hypothetical protein
MKSPLILVLAAGKRLAVRQTSRQRYGRNPSIPISASEAAQTTVLPGGSKWPNLPGANLLQDAIPRLQV